MSNEGASDQIFWNFGFGSNMDPHYVQEKKQVTVEGNSHNRTDADSSGLRCPQNTSRPC